MEAFSAGKSWVELGLGLGLKLSSFTFGFLIYLSFPKSCSSQHRTDQGSRVAGQVEYLSGEYWQVTLRSDDFVQATKLGDLNTLSWSRRTFEESTTDSDIAPTEKHHRRQATSRVRPARLQTVMQHQLTPLPHNYLGLPVCQKMQMQISSGIPPLRYLSFP